MLADLGLSNAAERATVKLLASLPAVQRDRAAIMRERLHIDLAGWSGQRDDPAWLPMVQEAVWQDRRLAMRYRPVSGEGGERIVEPLGTRGQGQRVVSGRAHGGEFRTYRVARIEHAALLDERVERPADFDLAAHWRQSSSTLMDRRVSYEATLRVDPRVATWVTMWGGMWRVEQREDVAEGRVVLHMRFEREEQALFLALGLGRWPRSFSLRTAARHASRCGDRSPRRPAPTRNAPARLRLGPPRLRPRRPARRCHARSGLPA